MATLIPLSGYIAHLSTFAKPQIVRGFHIFPIIILIISLDASVSTSNAAMCDLSPLVLPERTIPIALKAKPVNVFIKGRLNFQASQDNTYAILEETTATIPAARKAIENVIKDEVGALPNDPCGAQASLGSVEAGVTNNNLLVQVPLNGEQWGCVIGVKGQIASGTLLFKIIFAPRIVDSKLVLMPAVSQTGEISSNIPDIDATVTEAIKKQTQNATASAVDAVKQAVGRIQSRLDNMQSNLDDATAPIRPIYHPTVKSVQFRAAGDAILLVQERASEAREGTTCAIRKLALEKWTAKE
jgi:hypothetical protein